MTLRGRHYLMLWLLLFLVVAVGVVARQSSAFRTATTLRQLKEERLTLEAKAADYERRIREASSRRTLGRIAEDLGLHEPADSEVTPIVVPRARDGR